MKKNLSTLVLIIENDIKLAATRRDSFEKGSNEYVFNHAEIIALKTVLHDMRELKLIN